MRKRSGGLASQTLSTACSELRRVFDFPVLLVVGLSKRDLGWLLVKAVRKSEVCLGKIRGMIDLGNTNEKDMAVLDTRGIRTWPQIFLLLTGFNGSQA